jgi:diguanylate cyclase (GGDEF)-like protein/PAS domain S-box-containing protein
MRDFNIAVGRNRLRTVGFALSTSLAVIVALAFLIFDTIDRQAEEAESRIISEIIDVVGKHRLQSMFIRVKLEQWLNSGEVSHIEAMKLDKARLLEIKNRALDLSMQSIVLSQNGIADQVEALGKLVDITVTDVEALIESIEIESDQSIILYNKSNIIRDIDNIIEKSEIINSKITDLDPLHEFHYLHGLSVAIVIAVFAVYLFFVIFPLRRKMQRDANKYISLSEEVWKLSEIARRTENAAIITDTDGFVEWVNAGFERISGFSSAEVIGKRPGSILQFEGTDPQTIKQISAAIKNRQPIQTEILNRGKTGRIYWLSLDIQPLVTPRGEFVGFMAIESDITELKETSNALLTKNNDLEMMSQMAKVGVWSIDLVTDAVEWSSQVRSIRGVGPDYVPTFDRVISFYAPESKERIVEDLSRCRNEGVEVDQEYALIDTTGVKRRVRVYAKVVRDTSDGGKLIGTIQDITELANTRDGLQQSNDRLELATESGTVGLWDWSSAEGYVWVHPNWWMHLGFAGSQERPPHEFIHPEDYDSVKNKWAESVDGHAAVYQAEFRLLDGNGDWHWVQSKGKVTDRSSDGSVTRMSGVFVDIHHRKLAEQRIAYAASHDSMTGLVNREEIRRIVNETLSPNAYERLCVLTLDLDRFKHINDAFGHEAGDVVLNTVTSRLRKIARKKDIVARLGGDEFCIVVATGRNWQAAADRFAARAIEAISKPVTYRGASLQVGVSIGVAVYPDHGADFDTLLRNADAALYKVKHSGKNNYYLFNAELAKAVEARRELEAELAVAIERGELELYFQKQVNLGSNETVAAEALLRWKHPTKGMIPPDVFIPLAEENGLIVPIGEWVIEEACQKASTWPQPWVVSVNLSAMQLGKSDLFACVMGSLRKAGLGPERLEIEVTESVFLMHDQKLLKDLHKLHETGVSLALDDFGTGYASLSYLQKLPFSKVKLDKSFVSDIETNTQSSEIAVAIASLCRNLVLQTTAEGIETETQRVLITAAGYTCGQGYLFAKPMANEALVASEMKVQELQLQASG